MQKLKSIERVEESFAKLPSIGKKSAERLAYALFMFSDEDIAEFADAIKEMKANIHICPKCGMLAESEYCDICNDKSRDPGILMIVSYPKDVLTIEKSGAFNGKYHVLNGELSVSKGMNVEKLNLPSLFRRIEDEHITEVIFATNPTVDGELTARYLSKELEVYKVNVTRLAYGLQMGGNLDYVDPLTFAKALEGRHKL